MHSADVLLFLLLDLAIIILAARAFGWAANRIGQPRVIGEIVAGIAFGPTVLGRIAPSLQHDLFPPEVPLRSIADLGLVFFMFLVGLELDTKLVRREGKRALTISLSGVLTPFLFGALIAIPLLPINNAGTFLEGVTGPPSALSFALFLGAAMCITAFPVLARILIERGLYKTPLGTVLLCAAAVDDVIAWILLASVVGLARTGTPIEALYALGLTALFVLFMVVVVRRLLQMLARRYEAVGHLTVDQVALVVVGVLLSAWATERIGIHSIFGAFIFGAIMPQASRMTHELTDRVEDFTIVVLLPVFFTVSGLRTNLFAINSPDLIGWTVLIVVAATIGKMAGCGIAARLNGFSPRDSFVVGTLMNTRGLAELVILSVGLSLGVLSDRTFAMMVIMALVTTYMAAPIIARLLPRDQMVRVLSGSSVIGEEPVASRVLVAIGNPLNAPMLVDAAIRLTGQQRPAELLLVRLIPTPRAPEFRTGLRDEESMVDAAIEGLASLVDQAAAAGIKARPVAFLTDDVAQDLTRIAAVQDCDTILLGWHRPSLDRRVIRALVHQVFRLATCDVVVFVDRAGRGIQFREGGAVLVGVAGSNHDLAVEEIGLRLAQNLSADLRLFAAESSTGDRLADVANELRERSAVPAAPLAGDPVGGSAAAIIAVIGVSDPIDKEVDFGQPASGLSETFDCPVLVVRAASVSISSEPEARVLVPAV